MNFTARRRSPIKHTAAVLLSAGALVAGFSAISGASVQSHAGTAFGPYPPGGLTATQKAAAVKYVGGKAGAAKGTPVKVGWLNDESGTPAYPENTGGADLAVWFINTYLGGIKGHPIQLDKCYINVTSDAASCAQQMVNDHVKVVITGTVIYGNSTMYSTLFAAHIPVLEGNSLTSGDFGAANGTPGHPGSKVAAAFMPASPGVVKGLAKFIGTGGTGSKPASISVIYTTDPAASAAYALLFKTSKYLTGIKINGVGISATAGSSDVQTALVNAKVSSTKYLVTLIPVQSCISVYDAMKTLNLLNSTKVVTTGLCFGKPMIDHLHGTLPNGWYFGEYGVNYFMYSKTDPASVQLAVYIAAVHSHEPSNFEYTGFAAPSFGNVMVIDKFYNQLGLSATSAQLGSTIWNFKGPQWGLPSTQKCGFFSFLPSICSASIGVSQYSGGKWYAIQDSYNKKLINAFT